MSLGRDRRQVDQGCRKLGEEVSWERSTAFKANHPCGLKQITSPLCLSFLGGTWDDSSAHGHQVLSRMKRGALEGALPPGSIGSIAAITAGCSGGFRGR